MCSFLFSPDFFPRWLAASCGLARRNSAEDFFSVVFVIRHVAGKERGTIFGRWATLLKRSSRIVDRRLGMALVGLLSDRREEVLPADKESDRLYNRSQVCRESVYFNLHK